MGRQQLKQAVYDANMALDKSGLVLFTFGNVSGVDRGRNRMAIKPSGVPYDELTPEMMVLVSLETGNAMETRWKPSSDTATHLEIYRAFPSCGGVVHTHSEYATACAQSRFPIRCMGTTHADYFYGDIPVTRPLTKAETRTEYEKNTGHVIVETFASRDPEQIPAALVANHGPFVWGKSPDEAVHLAVIVEFLAKLAHHGRLLNPEAPAAPRHLVDKHYLRKHGTTAYYGQPDEGN